MASLPHPIYAPLDNRASTYFRLFKIEAREQSSGLLSLSLTPELIPQEHSGTKYTVLSYQWGPSLPARTIHVNGRELQIRHNLFEFLFHIGDDEARKWLWADAICINQEDVVERGQQVALMGRIFTNAETVIAWTGGSSQSTPHVVDFVQGFTRSRSIVTRFAFSMQQIEAVYALSVREYWTRTWIVQELALPPSPTIACGLYRVSLHDLQSAILLARYRVNTGYDPTTSSQHRYHDSYASNLFDKITSTSIFTTTTSQVSNIADLLYQHRHSQCLDPRDKVYALRALACDVDERALVPDYTIDIHDLYWQVLALSRVTQQGFRFELLKMLSISALSLLDHEEALGAYGAQNREKSKELEISSDILFISSDLTRSSADDGASPVSITTPDININAPHEIYDDSTSNRLPEAHSTSDQVSQEPQTNSLQRVCLMDDQGERRKVITLATVHEDSTVYTITGNRRLGLVQLHPASQNDTSSPVNAQPEHANHVAWALLDMEQYSVEAQRTQLALLARVHALCGAFEYDPRASGWSVRVSRGVILALLVFDKMIVRALSRPD